MLYQSGDNLHVILFFLDKLCLETLGRFVVDYLPLLSFISSLLKDIRVFLGFVVDYPSLILIG
jgi:hypothetical protein